MPSCRSNNSWRDEDFSPLKTQQKESKIMVLTQTEKPHMFEGIRRVVFGDPIYPLNLQDVQEAPIDLWYRGNLKKSDRVAVAIAGTRRSSEQGEKRAFRLGAQLAQEGVVVVSGLALGIDGAAHRGALSVGGRTLAVIGTGLNRIYPQEHSDLAKEIEKTGAIISQFLPEYTGAKGGRNFLKRNHVITGMAQVLVAVEGEMRSGTTAAVGAAIGQGRPVGLLRSLFQSQEWARQLIEKGQAFQVDNTEDVLRRVEF